MANYKLVLFFCTIQADQSGTVVDILAEDGKSVSVDTVSIFLAILTTNRPVNLIAHNSRPDSFFFPFQPLFVIEP